jgi:hypothetical protein
MTPDDLERESYAELRRLSEMLFDVARGRESSRAGVAWQAGTVVRRLRGVDALFTEDAGDALTDRLLEIADDWLPVDVLMASTLAVILGEPLPEPPSWAAGRQRANLSDGEAMQ